MHGNDLHINETTRTAVPSHVTKKRKSQFYFKKTGPKTEPIFKNRNRHTTSRFVMVKPAQLNSRSAVALAGSGVLSLTMRHWLIQPQSHCSCILACDVTMVSLVCLLGTVSLLCTLTIDADAAALLSQPVTECTCKEMDPCSVVAAAVA